MEEAQKFLADRIKSIATMAAPINPGAKMVLNLEGSTPTREDEYNPGPLIKIDQNGIGLRQDDGGYRSVQLPPTGGFGIAEKLLGRRDKTNYDPELGAYGPGRL